MTFRQMEIYTAVCECGSITKASVKYHVSPQGISKTVRELEKELGCELLLRSVAGVSLTPRGSFFFDECRRMLEWEKAISSRLAQLEAAPKETLWIGMAFGVISAVPTDLFSGFEALHPGVKICYSDNTDLSLEAQLERGEFDLCLTTGVMDRDRIEAEIIASEPVYLCIPKNHELYGKKTIAMEDLDAQRFAMFSSQFFLRHLFDETCRKAGIKPDIEYVSNDFNSLLNLAQKNSVLFAMPCHCADILGDQCRYTRFPDEDLLWSIFLAKRRHVMLSSTAESFYLFALQKMEGVLWQ